MVVDFFLLYQTKRIIACIKWHAEWSDTMAMTVQTEKGSIRLVRRLAFPKENV